MTKIGRPTKFKEEYIEQAYKLTMLGFTDSDLASFFEVDESTINNWKNDYPEFLESLKKGKAIADAEVAMKLYARAMGYKTQEFREEDSKTVVVTKEVAPDTTAQIFWLKNRQPKLWRDKQEIDNISTDGSMSPVRELSDEELLKIANNSRTGS